MGGLLLCARKWGESGVVGKIWGYIDIFSCFVALALLFIHLSIFFFFLFFFLFAFSADSDLRKSRDFTRSQAMAGIVREQ